MPVQLSQPGFPKSIPLTSPLEAAIANLGDQWIAEQRWYGERQIALTVPFPDKLRLTGDILLDDLLHPDQSGKSIKQAYTELDGELLTFVSSFPAAPALGVEAIKQIKYAVQAKLSDEAGFLGWAELKRRKGPDFGLWSISIEFSPYKVGKERLNCLIDKLELAFCMFDFVKLIARLRISRCDCAIDIYGVKPFDLILRQDGVGKASGWQDVRGHETVYLYAPKSYPSKPPKHGSYRAHGRLVARIYDRTAFSKWHCQMPPAGGLPVTRFEVQRNWKSNRPNLETLSEVKNMLDDVGAGFAWPTSLQGNERWRRIHQARFPIRRKWAEIGAPIAAGIELNQLYDAFPPDLISSASWTRWSEGLSLTGLDGFILT